MLNIHIAKTKLWIFHTVPESFRTEISVLPFWPQSICKSLIFLFSSRHGIAPFSGISIKPRDNCFEIPTDLFRCKQWTMDYILKGKKKRRVKFIAGFNSSLKSF